MLNNFSKTKIFQIVFILSLSFYCGILQLQTITFNIIIAKCKLTFYDRPINKDCPAIKSTECEHIYKENIFPVLNKWGNLQYDLEIKVNRAGYRTNNKNYDNIYLGLHFQTIFGNYLSTKFKFVNLYFHITTNVK